MRALLVLAMAAGLFADGDDAAGAKATALMIVILAVAIPVYLLPTFIAYYRGHKNFAAVLLVNIFLGWLLVGWVVALVWSVLSGQEANHYGRRGRPSARDDEPNPFDHPTIAPVAMPAVFHFTCPRCRRPVQLAAGMLGMLVACGHCGQHFNATPTAPPA